MTIYLIAEEQYAGEDNSGRDIYRTAVNEELGYFTDREAAANFIAECHAADAKRWEEVNAEYKERVAAENDRLEPVRQAARDAGLSAIGIKGRYLPRPRSRDYVTYREIVAVEPA